MARLCDCRSNPATVEAVMNMTVGSVLKTAAKPMHST